MGHSQSKVIESFKCDGGSAYKQVLSSAASTDFNAGLSFLPLDLPAGVSQPEHLFDLTEAAQAQWRRAMEELCRSDDDAKALTAMQHLLFDLQLLGWKLEQSHQHAGKAASPSHATAAQTSPAIARELQVHIARRFALACEVCVEEDRWQLVSTSLSELWVRHHHPTPKLSTLCLMLPVAIMIRQLLEPESTDSLGPNSLRRSERKPQTVRVCSSLVFHFMRTMQEPLRENHRQCVVEFRRGMHELLRELKRCCDLPAHQSKRGHVPLLSTAGPLTEQEIQDPCFSLCLGFALSVINIGVLLFVKSLSEEVQTETQRWTAVTAVIADGLSTMSSAIPIVGSGVGDAAYMSSGLLGGLISWAEEKTHHSKESAAKAKLIMQDFIQNTQDHAGIERFAPPRLQDMDDDVDDDDEQDNGALTDLSSATKDADSAAASSRRHKGKHGQASSSSSSEHSKEKENDARAATTDTTDDTTKEAAKDKDTTKEAAKDKTTTTETAAAKEKTTKKKTSTTTSSSSSSSKSATTTKADKARKTQAVHGSIYAASLLV